METVAIGTHSADPLPYLLTDHRVARLTHYEDDLWLRFMDVPAALEARKYQADLSAVIDVSDGFRDDGGRFALEVREVRRERGRGEVRGVAALAVGARRDDATAELAGRGDAHRGRGTRPAFAQARHISLPKRAGSSDGAQHLVRDEQRRACARAATDEQREELVVRQR